RGARDRGHAAARAQDAPAAEGAPSGVTARRRAPARPSATPARAFLDPRELRKLTVLMEESGLVELEIESAGERVRLVRGRVADASAAEPATATRAARREPE